MKYILKNAKIFAEIDSLGAELTDLQYNNLQILYKKHPDFWQRQSPVLFPIVGGLKNKEYFYNNQRYVLPQHGFARDMEFDCIFQNDSELHFCVKSNTETRENYPFDFELFVRYYLEENSLRVEYEVKNLANGEMYYSIGGHPAFAISDNVDQYLLKFDKNMKNQVMDRIHPTEFLLDEKYAEDFQLELDEETLRLDEKYFAIDAMIFRDIESRSIDFCHENERIFTFSYKDFPHLGVWKQPNSPFICLEPWDGYVDMIDASGKIEEKSGIQKLEKGESRKYAWSVEF